MIKLLRGLDTIQLKYENILLYHALIYYQYVKNTTAGLGKYLTFSQMHRENMIPLPLTESKNIAT